jgi:hypothetical protein
LLSGPRSMIGRPLRAQFHSFACKYIVHVHRTD